MRMDVGRGRTGGWECMMGEGDEKEIRMNVGRD